MESLEAKLVQYRALVDQRLHFGRLYYQVIATNLTLVTGATIAVGIGRPGWWTATVVMSGSVLAGTGLVAHCLHRQEERYVSAMNDIESELEGMILILETRRFGARRLVAIALVAVGLLTALGAIFA